jgi:hypothetical protein
VKWDAVISGTQSIRAPYTAYIELVVPERLVAHEACARGYVAGCESNVKRAYRYSYNLGPTGLQFEQVQEGLVQKGYIPPSPINWAVNASPGPPTSCWAKAARGFDMKLLPPYIDRPEHLPATR